MGLDCSGCRKPKDRCVCFKSSRVPLGPRPTARSTDTAPRVSRLPSTVRPTATTGRVSPAASVRATTTATPALERTPTNYSNVAYKGLVDLPYNNTGPDYDPSRAGLTATQERLRTGLTEIDRGRRDLAGRYEQLELRNQKIQGNHSDVPTYGRDSLYRTASDTVTHDAYHDKDHTRMLEDATKAVGPAKEAKGAQLNSKAPDSMPHVQVVQVMRTAQDAHLKNADARMTYMEAYPNGLNDARSHRTHVGAAKDSLQSAVNYERDIKTQSQIAYRKESEALASSWSVDPRAGEPYYSRPPSAGTLSSGSSRVSSSRSGSGPPPTFASGSGIKRQCQHTYEGGSRCRTMTRQHYCSDHR